MFFSNASKGHPIREEKKLKKIIEMHSKKIDHDDGTGTHNLLIFSQMPYPLGHVSLLYTAYNYWKWNILTRKKDF